jgi:hypothetical protein
MAIAATVIPMTNARVPVRQVIRTYERTRSTAITANRRARYEFENQNNRLAH